MSASDIGLRLKLGYQCSLCPGTTSVTSTDPHLVPIHIRYRYLSASGTGMDPRPGPICIWYLSSSGTYPLPIPVQIHILNLSVSSIYLCPVPLQIHILDPTVSGTGMDQRPEPICVQYLSLPGTYLRLVPVWMHALDLSVSGNCLLPVLCKGWIRKSLDPPSIRWKDLCTRITAPPRSRASALPPPPPQAS